MPRKDGAKTRIARPTGAALQALSNRIYVALRKNPLKWASADALAACAGYPQHPDRAERTAIVLRGLAAKGLVVYDHRRCQWGLVISNLPTQSRLRSITADAYLSQCGTYRYWLSRCWDRTKHTIVWVMLNPSTADALIDDPTIRRCTGFAKAWGAGSILVVNLFAYRATDPKTLPRDRGRAAGPDNLPHLNTALSLGAPVVCAWGAHPLAWLQLPHLLALPHCDDLQCLGVTASGAPKHPLYLKASTLPESWKRPPTSP